VGVGLAMVAMVAMVVVVVAVTRLPIWLSCTT